MILTLILLLVMTLAAILVVKKKNKQQRIFPKIEDTNLVEIDAIPVAVEKPIEPVVEVKLTQPISDQPKKKRKYNKKKHPKKMDVNKK